MRRFLTLLLIFVLAAAGCSASTTTSASGPSTSDDAAATDSADSADSPEIEEPVPTVTPTAEPTAVPEPTATAVPEPADDEAAVATAMLEQSELGDNLSPTEIACVVKGLAQEPNLLANAISGTDFDTLELDDQVDTALIALDCAPEAAAAQFTQSFTDDFSQAQPTMGMELGDCLVAQLAAENPHRRNVLLGFATLGEDLPVPPEAEGALVDSISTCVPGPVFAEWLIAEFADDPAMANAIDTACIRDAFPDETIRQFWGAMVSEGGSMDGVDPEATAPLMNALFSCMSMGQIMADKAASDGVEISDETIACIDEGMAGQDLAAMMDAPDAESEAEFTAIVINCLTPEELAGLGR